MRDNQTSVWLPGMGMRYAFSNQFSLYGGVHRGFTAPSNSPGVDEEKSVNYEVGLRFVNDQLSLDTAAFFTDYENILGQCTASSGANCEVGASFNGDAASIVGLETQLSYAYVFDNQVRMPISLSYTLLNGEFDTDIADTDFFGDVSAGDALPYIPDHQALLTAGLERDALSVYARANYVDEVCTRGSCAQFERSDSFVNVDVSAHYALSDRFTLYGKWENALDHSAIVARQPYGARPLKDRSVSLGFRFLL